MFISEIQTFQSVAEAARFCRKEGVKGSRVGERGGAPPLVHGGEEGGGVSPPLGECSGDLLPRIPAVEGARALDWSPLQSTR